MVRTKHSNHRPLGSALAAALTASMLVTIAGCASSVSRDGVESSTPASNPGADPIELLARLAEKQSSSPDTRSIAAAPPVGVPAELATRIPELDLPKAGLSLDEALAQWPDPPAQPTPDERAAPEGPIDDAALEAVRSYVAGRAQRLAGDTKAAEASLRESARLDPRSARTWAELAETNLMLGNQSAAAAALRRTLELDPFHRRALDLQSRFEMDRRAYAEAANLLARLMRHEPERLDPALPKVAGARLGEALLQLGHLRAGAEALNAALDLPSSYGEVTAYQQELGLLYRERGDLYRDVGDALLRMGDGAAAVQAYASASRLPTLNPASLVTRRLYALMRAGEPAKAALLLLDEIEGRAGQIDQTVVGLVAHVAQHSDVGPLLASGVERIADSIYPAPRPSVRGLLVRVRAAALPDDKATALLREHLASNPADADALRELMKRRGGSDQTRIDETLALIERAPIYESRFAQALLLSESDPSALTDALRQHPRARTAAARLLLARIQTLRGELDQADATLADLLTEQPAYAPAAVARSIGLIRMGRTPEASALLAGVDEAADPDVRVAKALALTELGDFEAALTMLDPLLDPSAPPTPARADRLLLGARLYAQQQKFEQCERLLLSVLEIDPARDEAFADLVRLYNRGSPLASDEKLVELIRRVRDADPSSPTLRWLRAQESMQRRQYDLARRDLVDLAEEYPDRPGVVEALRQAWYTTGDVAGLEKWLREKAAALPDDSVYTILLADVLDEQKRSDEALRLLEVRLAARPGDDAVSRALETLLRRDPVTRRRADELATARIARGPRTPDSQAELAEIALSRGDAQTAADLLRGLLDAPRQPSPRLAQNTFTLTHDLAMRSLRGGFDAAVALELLKRAINAAPNPSIEARMTQARLMVHTRQQTPVIIAAIEDAAQKDESVRRPMYAAAIDECFGGRANQKPDDPRRMEGLEILAQACKAIRPAPADLQKVWIQLALSEIQSIENTVPLAAALTSIREAGNIDEVLDLLSSESNRRDQTDGREQVAFFLATVLHPEKQADLIEWLYRTTIRLNPKHVLANNNLGYKLLTDDRDIDEAASMIQIAYESMVNDPNVGERASVTDSLGWARYKQGIILDERDADGKVTRQGAVTLLTKALEHAKAEPENMDAIPIIADHLADALWLAGERERAVELWVEAMARARGSLDRLRGIQGERPLSASLRQEVSDVLNQASVKVDLARAGELPPVCKVHRATNVPPEVGAPPAPILNAEPAQQPVEAPPPPAPADSKAPPG